MSDNPVLQGAQHPPFWLDELGPDRAPPSAPLPSKAKWLIIGGGIAGGAAALELRSAGEEPASVCILDALAPGWGASGRNAGFVLSNLGTEVLQWRDQYGEAGAREWVDLIVANRRAVSDVVASEGLLAQRGGSMFIAGSEQEGELIRESYDVLCDWTSEPWEFLSHPPADWPHQHACLCQERDFGINSAEYLLALLRLSGAAVVGGALCSPSGLTTGATGWRLETSLGVIQADNLIVATNAWTDFVLEGRPAPERITPARNQVVLASLPGHARNTLWGEGVYYANQGYDYWRQLRDGRILVGGGRNHAAQEETTWDYGTTATILDYLEGDLLPKLCRGEKFEVIRRWSGILGFSSDLMPCAGRLPGRSGGGFLVGFSGHGLATHRIAARRLVAHLLHGETLGVLDAGRLRG